MALFTYGPVETQVQHRVSRYLVRNGRTIFTIFLIHFAQWSLLWFCLNVNPYLVIIHYICHLWKESNLLLDKFVHRRNTKDHMDCEVASLESKNCWSMLDLHPGVCVCPKKTIMNVGVKSTYSAQVINYTVVQTNNRFKVLSSYWIVCGLNNPVTL